MARQPREHRLETREARAKLKVRTEPYWRQIVPGTFLGLRKGKTGSAWIARQRRGEGYAEQRIGTPDDHADPDGAVVLSYGQAVQRATTLQVEARAPQPRHYGDGLPTVNDVVAAYFDEKLAGRSSEGISRGYWKLHGAGDIGKRRVDQTDVSHLRKWHRVLSDKAPTVRGKALEFDRNDEDQVRARRASANRILTIPKAALNAAWREELSIRLPDAVMPFWQKVEPLDLGEEPVPRMMEDDEIRRLLNAAEADLRQLLSGALMTGMRLGELIRRHVRDYVAESASIRIYQRKTGKYLQQPLTPEGIRFFDRLTAGRAPTAPMFTKADGMAWSRHDINRPVRRAVAAAKLEDVTFKTTRATYGKLLLLATRDIEIVAKALGHSDSRITRKHYAQYLPNEIAAGVAKLPALGVAPIDDKVSSIRGKSGRPAD